MNDSELIDTSCYVLIEITAYLMMNSLNIDFLDIVGILMSSG